MHQAWEDLRPRASVVQWCELVWYSKSIPKHCFTLWLDIRNQLLTQDRLKSWQIHDQVLCSFCERVPDSRSHLFFECEFALTFFWNFREEGIRYFFREAGRVFSSTLLLNGKENRFMC